MSSARAQLRETCRYVFHGTRSATIGIRTLGTWSHLVYFSILLKCAVTTKLLLNEHLQAIYAAEKAYISNTIST